MSKRTCKLENCDLKHFAKEFCNKHYQQAVKTGEVVRTPKKELSDLERFWQYVSKTASCWNWVGGLTGAGYGIFSTGKRGNKTFKQMGAHKYAYLLSKGEIPANYQIDHLCRNTKCVNPSHLEAVTARVNTLRGIGASAINSRKTHCKRGHLLQGENLYHIPSGGRACKTCRAKSQDEFLERQTLISVEKAKMNL